MSGIIQTLWYNYENSIKNLQHKKSTDFWDQKDILLLDFLPIEMTINADMYCATLSKLKCTIQNCWWGLLSHSIILLHDNAWPHIATRTKMQLDKFHWEVLDHPSYNTNLAPFYLFPKLKEFLGRKRLKNVNDDVENMVPRFDKCLNVNDDYREK